MEKQIIQTEAKRDLVDLGTNHKVTAEKMNSLLDGGLVDMTVMCCGCGAEYEFAHDTAYEPGDSWVDGTHCDKCDHDTYDVLSCTALIRGKFMET